MTSVRASATLRAGGRQESRSLLLLSALLPVATGVSILGVALLLLLTPIWMHWALEASGGANALVTPEQALAVSDFTVGELIFGPATFIYGGSPLYTPEEIAHLRDVRLVLLSFLALAGASAVLLVAATRRAGTNPPAALGLPEIARRGAIWRAVGRGGLGLAVLLVALGVFAVLAFGVAFEVFHRLLFPGGNWAFDASSRLVNLYPLAFWQLSAAAMGVLGLVGGLTVWRGATRRASALERTAAAARDNAHEAGG